MIYAEDSMADDRKDAQDNWAEDKDFLIANDDQIADMQREYASLGVSGSKNQSRLCAYPLPVQEIFLPAQRMPIKQSMYRLIELHNFMSIALDGLSEYDKSVSMQEVICRHLLSGSILHGICI